MNDADYIIVGGGAAGCVLADRLTADGGRSVLLVEAGRPDPETYPEVQIPVLFHRMFGSELDWNFETVPQERLDGRRIPIPRGKALGGSSVIHAQLWTRGHRADFDGWAADGYHGWAHEDLLRYFERAEDRIRLGGLRYPTPSTADFLNACARLGYRPATEQQEGYVLAKAAHHDGLRWTSADGYLQHARDRDNLRILTGAQAQRVLFEGTRAVGVEVATPDGVRQLTSTQEVVLAAGSVGTPQLLMLSGVGPAEDLAALGIPVVVDAPHVGRNLVDHLVVPLAFEGLGFESPGADAGPEEMEQYLKDRTGPLDSVVSEAVLFLRTNERLAAPDVEVVHLVIPFGENPTQVRHGFALGVIQLKPHSRGTIRLRSADPAHAPLIDPGYLSDVDAVDLATVVAGVRRAQEILREPDVARWRGAPLTEGALADDDEAIAGYVRRTGMSIHHLVSSCRMHPRRDAGALDTSFRVHGATGLRVVDASAMPGTVRAHTYAAVTMLAEKASDLITAAD